MHLAKCVPLFLLSEIVIKTKVWAGIFGRWSGFDENLARKFADGAAAKGRELPLDRNGPCLA